METFQKINLATSLLNSENIFFVNTNLLGNYQFVNRAFENFFDYRLSELLNQPFMSTVFPDDHNSCIEAAELCLMQPGKKVALDLRKPNKNATKLFYTRWEFCALTNETGELVGVQAIGYDKSTEKERELEFQRLFELYSTATKATNNLIWDWDLASGQVERSRDIFEFHGLGGNQKILTGTDFAELIHPEDRDLVVSKLKEAIKEKNLDHWQGTYRIIQPDGSLRTFFDRAFIIRDKSGKALRLVGATEEISQLIDSKERIREQNDALKEIAYLQSHLTRKPLANIMGLISLIKKEESLDEKLALLEKLGMVASEVDKVIHSISTLVNQSNRI